MRALVPYFFITVRRNNLENISVIEVWNHRIFVNKKCSHGVFTSVWNRLTCWLSKDVLRRCWIVSGVTKPWTVVNFGNTLAMTIFFFSEMLENWWRFHKWNKKPRKCFLFFWELDLNRERQILTIRNRILVIGSPCEKPRKCFLFWRELDLNGERQILTISNRILVIGSPCVSKQPYDFKLQSGRYFLNHFSSQCWKNMVKVFSWRFY